MEQISTKTRRNRLFSGNSIFFPPRRPFPAARSWMGFAALYPSCEREKIAMGLRIPAHAKNCLRRPPNSLSASLRRSLPRSTGIFTASHCSTCLKLEANRRIPGLLQNSPCKTPCGQATDPPVVANRFTSSTRHASASPLPPHTCCPPLMCSSAPFTYDEISVHST
jgi:hypothetical protein